jgi:hypothetical protein
MYCSKILQKEIQKFVRTSGLSVWVIRLNFRACSGFAAGSKREATLPRVFMFSGAVGLKKAKPVGKELLWVWGANPERALNR